MNLIQISNVTIRQQNDLYSLNDLHKASGGENKHRPTFWLQNQQTIDVIQELQNEKSTVGNPTVNENQGVIEVINGGKNRGTYVCKELVIHYGMWISAKFSLEVIRTFLEVKEAEQAENRLTDEQVGYLYNQVMRICGETGQAYQTVFGGLKRHFQVASYKHIKASDFAQACKWLGVPLPIETKEQPKGILMSEEQVYQLSTLTRYAQRMSLDFEHIAPALDRLDSKLAGRAYSWGVEPNHWICCIQRFLMQATKQMTNPKYIEGVRDNFVHMI